MVQSDLGGLGGDQGWRTMKPRTSRDLIDSYMMATTEFLHDDPEVILDRQIQTTPECRTFMLG